MTDEKQQIEKGIKTMREYAQMIERVTESLMRHHNQGTKLTGEEIDFLVGVLEDAQAYNAADLERYENRLARICEVPAPDPHHFCVDCGEVRPEQDDAAVECCKNNHHCPDHA